MSYINPSAPENLWLADIDSSIPYCLVTSQNHISQNNGNDQSVIIFKGNMSEYKPEEIMVSIEKEVITIEATNNDLRNSIHTRKTIIVSVPKDIDKNKITADFSSNGDLIITSKKKPQRGEIVITRLSPSFFQNLGREIFIPPPPSRHIPVMLNPRYGRPPAMGFPAPNPPLPLRPTYSWEPPYPLGPSCSLRPSFY